MDVAFLTSAFQKSHYPPTDRPEIAFAGKSNVGKSSLINVLVKRRGMAKTSAIPGRTRSINFFSVDEWLYLVDLPGYGYARVPQDMKRSWKPMVETYLLNRKNLKAVVVIVDIRRDPDHEDKELLAWLAHFGIPAIIILTKADKLSRQRALSRVRGIEDQLGNLCGGRPILFSARTREGREEIWGRIKQALDSKDPRLSS